MKKDIYTTGFTKPDTNRIRRAARAAGRSFGLAAILFSTGVNLLFHALFWLTMLGAALTAAGVVLAIVSWQRRHEVDDILKEIDERYVPEDEIDLPPAITPAPDSPADLLAPGKTEPKD